MPRNIQLTAGTAATFAARIYDNYAARVTNPTPSGPASFQLPPAAGFELIKSKFDVATNYYGEAWRNRETNELVVVSRGTVPDKRDGAADLNIAAGRLQPLLLADEDGGGSTALQAANSAFAAQGHDVQFHGIRGWGFVARPGGHELNALPPRAGNANRYLCAA